MERTHHSLTLWSHLCETHKHKWKNKAEPLQNQEKALFYRKRACIPISLRSFLLEWSFVKRYIRIHYRFCDLLIFTE